MTMRMRVAPKNRKATAIVIVFALSLVCARAQTAHEETIPPDDNLIILTPPGSFPGSGLKALWRHATTCDGFVSQASTNRQGSGLSGCVRGADKTKGAIKIQILYPGKIPGTVANVFGEFSFSDLPSGEYSVLATQDSKILAFKAVQIPLKMPLVMVVTPHFGGIGTLYLSEY